MNLSTLLVHSTKRLNTFYFGLNSCESLYHLFVFEKHFQICDGKHTIKIILEQRSTVGRLQATLKLHPPPMVYARNP